MRRIRGCIDLVFDLVEETTSLVERTHDAVVERSARRFAPIEPAKSAAKVVTGIQTAISGGVFESIRVINRITRSMVNAVAEVDLSQTSDSYGPATWYVDHFQSSLNGFWGDYLSRENSRLDLGMTLRHHGRHLPATPGAFSAAFPNPTNKVCVFVHGLAATESLWSLSSAEHYGVPDVTFGTRLREDLGFTPIYLRYNTGRHISENGRALAALLTEVLEAYPMPVEEIALVGHSMGGLVVRSAAHYGREHDEPWIAHLRHVACIAAPHLGAPLEKAVSLLTRVLKNIEGAGAQVPAELLDSRSAGIKDLRYGFTVDEEWARGVGYYFLAATISRHPDHPLGRLLGDLLVRLPSASGEAPEAARRIHFDSGTIFPGMNHLHIANHPDVYEVLRDMLAA